MSAPPPFLFVVGCGRSGTTVLRTILDAHPELAVTHESQFIVPLGIRRRRYEHPDGLDVDRFIRDLLADAGVRANLGLDEVWVREALATPVADYPDAVRRVFAAYARPRAAQAAVRRHEALIDEPDEVISGVCAFLDLDYDPALLRFFEQSGRVPAKVRSNPSARPAG